MGIVVLGLPFLAWLLRKRGRPGDPVPRGKAPVDRRGLPAALVLVAAYLLLLVAGTLLWFPLSGRPRPEPGAEPPRIPLVAGLLLDGIPKIAALLLVAGLLRRLGGSRDPRPSPAPRAAAAGLLSALAFLPLLAATSLLQSVLWNAAGWKESKQVLVEEAGRGPPVQFAAVCVFAVVVAPLFEETLFRVHLYSGLRGWMGPLPAAVISAAAFSAMHMQAEAFAVTFLLGLCLADLRERTGGRSAPIAMHACYNAVQMAGILFLRAAGDGAAGG